MINSVKAGEGVVYNPVSESVLTNEGSLEFVESLESKINNIDYENVPNEILKEAYIETQSSESYALEKEVNLPLIQPRASSVPTTTKYLENGESYTSDQFSGSGWRYSGVKFRFRDWQSNPYFAVKATKDSFYFHVTVVGRYVVPKDGAYLWYPARLDEPGSTTVLTGYFSTYNPINGARYYIY